MRCGQFCKAEPRAETAIITTVRTHKHTITPDSLTILLSSSKHKASNKTLPGSLTFSLHKDKTNKITPWITSSYLAFPTMTAHTEKCLKFVKAGPLAFLINGISTSQMPSVHPLPTEDLGWPPLLTIPICVLKTPLGWGPNSVVKHLPSKMQGPWIQPPIPWREKWINIPLAEICTLDHWARTALGYRSSSNHVCQCPTLGITITSYPLGFPWQLLVVTGHCGYIR